MGVDIDGDTSTHFLCFCPFHGNTDTTAFAVDKTAGVYHCFNPSCDASGTMKDLLRELKGLNPFQITREINKRRHVTNTPFSERMQEAMAASAEFPSMSESKIEELHEVLWASDALGYMYGRGFTDETLRHFQVGYSPAREYPPPYKSRPEMVVVPMHDINGNAVGVVGRSIMDKQFKNSKHLPKSLTAWNIHRARKHGSTVIVCESTFDAMRIHQAGYPNVVALLGGHASPAIIEQLGRNFSKVIIMTDFDKIRYQPNCRRCKDAKMVDGVRCEGHRDGRDLGRELVAGLQGKKIMWAAYDDTCVYPHNAKDAGDMTDEEIRQCLRNAISNLEYSLWNIENKVA